MRNSLCVPVFAWKLGLISLPYKCPNEYLMYKKDLVHFISDSIFKRLKFDDSSSETLSNQKIKIKNYFYNDCVFLEIRLSHGNQLLPNIAKNK